MQSNKFTSGSLIVRALVNFDTPSFKCTLLFWMGFDTVFSVLFCINVALIGPFVNSACVIYISNWREKKKKKRTQKLCKSVFIEFVRFEIDWLSGIMVDYDENDYAAEVREKPVCRFCLSQEDSLTNIYSVKSNANSQVSLSMQIMACVSIEVRIQIKSRLFGFLSWIRWTNKLNLFVENYQSKNLLSAKQSESIRKKSVVLIKTLRQIVLILCQPKIVFMAFWCMYWENVI